MLLILLAGTHLLHFCPLFRYAKTVPLDFPWMTHSLWQLKSVWSEQFHLVSVLKLNQEVRPRTTQVNNPNHFMQIIFVLKH